MYWINVAQIMDKLCVIVNTTSSGVNSSVVLHSFMYIP